MDRTKGCLSVFLALLLLGIIVNLLRATWPVCLPTVVAITGWIVTAKRSSAVTKGIHEVLGPVTVGLLLVCGLMLLFAVTSPSVDEVGHVERAIVFADNLPAMTKLSTLRFSVLMIVLTGVACLLPRAQAVTRFFTVKKWAGRTSAAVAMASSFTFFTNATVVQPKAGAIYEKIEALYRKSKEGQAKEVDRYLAAKAMQRALTGMQAGEREYFQLLVQGIAGVPTLDLSGQKELAGYTSMHLHQRGALLPNPEEAVDAAAVHAHGEALHALDEQLETEKAAKGFAEQAVKAAQESLNLGNDRLKELAWSLVERLIGDEAGEIARLARPFVDKILDNQFESYTEPLIKRQAERVRRFFQPGQTGEAARVLARKETQSAVVLMSANEAERAKASAEKALEAAQQAKADAEAGNADRAAAELGDAQLASGQAMEEAKLAKSAAAAVSDSGHALFTGSDQMKIAIAVAGATDAAKSLRAAAEAEAAINSAKNAARIVEDARAARAAAEAAEAAKTVLRVIPK
ncbi:hypothetical protein DYQ86_19315 [Acidobacteria bacterium AB60]|nr:hypothetical protein DYQ86_19315 [Acidobacteria bacterium AB60]